MAIYFNPEQERAFLLSKHPGFWLVSTVVGPCDQTVESFTEHARFYACPIPSQLSQALSQSALGRRDRELNISFDTLAASPIKDILAAERPSCPYAENFIRRTRAEMAHDTLGWTVYGPPEGHASFLGAIELSWGDDLLVMPSADGDFSAPEASLYHLAQPEFDQSMLTANALCSATLDNLERRLGLPQPTLARIQGAEPKSHPASFIRARWGDEHAPMCLDQDNSSAASAMMERLAIVMSSPSATLASKRPHI
jgi:hypothetical protein